MCVCVSSSSPEEEEEEAVTLEARRRSSTSQLMEEMNPAESSRRTSSSSLLLLAARSSYFCNGAPLLSSPSSAKRKTKEKSVRHRVRPLEQKEELSQKTFISFLFLPSSGLTKRSPSGPGCPRARIPFLSPTLTNVHVCKKKKIEALRSRVTRQARLRCKEAFIKWGRVALLEEQ